jgi:hypothetical protein
MRFFGFQSFWLAVGCFVFGSVGHSQEKPLPPPQITALSPIAVPPGFTGVVRLRGIQIKDATEIRAGSSTKLDKLALKEKKDAAVPNGMEKDLVGEHEITVDLALPANFPPGPLPLTVTARGLTTNAVPLLVVPAANLVSEKEPNPGFRQAMKIAPGQMVVGLIKEPRDVDVFEIVAKKGQKLRVTVTASGATSLCDPLLTAHDTQGQPIAARDDASLTSRDATIDLTPVADGPVYLVVQDALDFGGDWHGYRLEVSAPAPAEAAVSFSSDVWPILRANCASCHRPGKLKGELDLTTFAALSKGGKHGAILKSRAPQDSPVLAAVSGPEPEMPPEGETLTSKEIAILTRWIAQGAPDDTPPVGLVTRRPVAPPVYRTAPAIPAIAFLPDGSKLAVAGHHEILIHQGDGEKILGRWPGDSPRLESLQFSQDGRFLAASGGSSSEFGEIQIWEVATGTLTRSIRAGNDALYGVSWSNDGAKLAAGGADKLVRAFDAKNGKTIMQCDNHLDWVFGAAFVHDGSKLVSVSRDKAVKLIDVATGHLIDDAARPREPVLALARHPKEDLVAFTGMEGKVRLHKMAPRGGRLKEGDDKEESAVREFEGMSTPLHAVAFSPDGTRLACAGQSGEIRVFEVAAGKRLTSIPGTNGPIYTLAFHPKENWLAAAGSEGRVRYFDAATGKPVKDFAAVPLAP